MDIVEKQQEQLYLQEVLKKISVAKVSLENLMSTLGSNILQKLKEFREGSEADALSSDFTFFMQQLYEKDAAFNFEDKIRKLKEYDYLLQDPYFARIDLYIQQSGETKRLYIGKFGYTEQNPVVTDWRARIASVYYRYRYPQKDVHYETPLGPEKADLLLKRTYEIEDGELIKYYNNDIQLDENDIISEKIEQRTGGVLEDIVETIQVSQLDVIESDPRQITIVQGCVGSGKSTVAVHKLSHIFFNYPDIIHPKRALLLAKSQILVGYLSTLFPKLGIFDITYKTLRDLVVNVLHREGLITTVNMDEGIDTSAFTLKLKHEIDKRVAEIYTEVEESVTKMFSEDEFESFRGFRFSKALTIFENISELNADLEEEYTAQSQLLKEDPDSAGSWLYKENVKTLRKLLKSLSLTKNQLQNKIFTGLLGEYEINTKKPLNYYETLLYVYIFSKLIGISKFIRFEYCVVDEAQDFSLLEYSILSNFVLRGRFALFGDLNQLITEEGLTSWGTISTVIEEAKKAQVFELTTNYRSTKPIIDLANNILKPFTQKYLPKSINRKGSDPVIKTFNSESELTQAFNDMLQDDLRTLDKSIGIIAFNDTLLEKANEFVNKSGVSKDHIIQLKNNTKINYIPKGVYIMKSNDCKGLEFSKVYVLGFDLSKINDFSTAKKAFVAVTRAMNEIVVLGLK